MKYRLSLIARSAVLLLAVTSGCRLGKRGGRGSDVPLAKDDANALLKKNVELSPALVCVLNESVQEEGSGSNRSYTLVEGEARQQKCITELQTAGLISSVRPESGRRVRFALSGTS